jgi:hypothetical protein
MKIIIRVGIGMTNLGIGNDKRPAAEQKAFKILNCQNTRLRPDFLQARFHLRFEGHQLPQWCNLRW